MPVAELSSSSACFISQDSPLADLIIAADLNVWHVLEAVNRSLQDITGSVDPAHKDLPSGGQVVVLGGDSRQILPEVPRGTRGDNVAASLKKSAFLRPHVCVYQLHQNMRLRRLLAEGGGGRCAACTATAGTG